MPQARARGEERDRAGGETPCLHIDPRRTRGARWRGMLAAAGNDAKPEVGLTTTTKRALRTRPLRSTTGGGA